MIRCTTFLTDFRDDEPLLGELYQTLSCLAVRNEFCQQIMDLGGVGLMLDTIAHNPNNQVSAHVGSPERRSEATVTRRELKAVQMCLIVH